MTPLINTALSLLIMAYVVVRICHKRDKEAWRNRLLPYAAAAYAATMAFSFVLVAPWRGGFVQPSLMPGLFCVAVIAVWHLLRWLIGMVGRNLPPAHPYYQEDATVYAEPGIWVRSVSAKVAAVLLAMLHLALAVVGFFSSGPNALALLPVAILPLVEYALYTHADVPVQHKPDTPTTAATAADPLPALWKQLCGQFADYGVAWSKQGGSTLVQLEMWDAEFRRMLDEFRNNHDLIVEDCPLDEAFKRLRPFLHDIEHSGKSTLVALDIPNYFAEETGKSYIQQVAEQVEVLFGEPVAVFDEQATADVLNAKIALTPLERILHDNMDYDRLESIGLIVVVDLQDRGVANLYECRKFSYLLRQGNDGVRLIFLTSSAFNAQAAIANTWHTEVQLDEHKIAPQAGRGFMLGYNAEGYMKRYAQVMKKSQEALYVGLEFAAVVSRGLPLHLLSVAYSNAIEGREDFLRQRHLLLSRIDDEGLDKRIVIHRLPAEHINEKHVATVVYDSLFNSPATYLAHQHQGRENNLTIVVSKPYLLRDFFNSEYYRLLSVPVLPLKPMLSRSLITLAIILFHQLQKTPVEEHKLRQLFSRYIDNGQSESIPHIIRFLFGEYLGIQVEDHLSCHEETLFDGTSYVKRTYYSIQLADDYRQPFLDNITVRDTAGNILFTIKRDLLWQNYAEGQIHSFSGRPYKIDSFDPNSKTLTVKKTDDNQGILFYRTALKIELAGAAGRHPIKGSVEESQGWVNHEGNEVKCRIAIYETPATVRVIKRFAFSSYGRTGCKSDEVQSSSLGCQRKYNRGRLMKLTLCYAPKPAYDNQKDNIRKSLQLLVYEVLRTLFPHHADYMVVASYGEGDNTLPWIFPILDIHESDNPNELSLLLFEDAHIDLGLIGALASHDVVHHLMRVIYDYLRWFTGSEMTPEHNDFAEYYCHTDADRQAFLRYGGDSLPDYFDADLLLQFLEDFYGDSIVPPGESIPEHLPHGQVKCDFCDRLFHRDEVETLSDGLMRCKECSRDAVDTEDHFNRIRTEAEEAFKTYLGIDFGTIAYSANLVSASVLHARGGYSFTVTDGYDKRTLTGLAVDSQHDEIFVEQGRSESETFGIICHELTHIWQYATPEFAPLRGDKRWSEGMAVWTDLFLSEKRGGRSCESMRKAWLDRNDEYGHGLRLVLERCPVNPFEYVLSHARNQ